MPKSRTITRADLSEAIHKDVRLSRGAASRLTDQTFELIVGALERNERVSISAFGTFEPRTSPPRTGRNPKTGEEVPIPARRVVSFRPSNILKRYINRTSATRG